MRSTVILWLAILTGGLIAIPGAACQVVSDEGSAMNQEIWATSGKLSNGGSQNTGQGVNLSATFPSAAVHTVQFNVTPIDGVVQKTFAEITWTIGGVKINRIISVVDGATISGVSDGVMVRVTDSSAIGGGSGTIEYDVSVVAGPGTRAAQSQQPILQGFGFLGSTDLALVPTAATGVTPIPADAGATSVFIALAAEDAADAPIDNDEIVIGFRSAADGTGILVGVSNATNHWIPIPVGARSVTLSNNRAAGRVRVSTIFGIDG